MTVCWLATQSNDLYFYVNISITSQKESMERERKKNAAEKEENECLLTYKIKFQVEKEKKSDRHIIAFDEKDTIRIGRKEYIIYAIDIYIDL